MANQGRRAGTMSWVDLQTPDLKKARAFYGELLGWRFVGGDDASMGHYTMAQLGGKNVAGLSQPGGNSPVPPMWSVYFATDDADATARAVTEAGGKIIAPPMDIAEEGRMAYFADPAGAYFGVWQGRKHQGAQVVGVPGAMAWHETYSRDAIKARDFYTRVFGLTANEMDMSGMSYWTLQLGEESVAGVMQLDDNFPKEAPSQWNTYFAVPNADAAVEKVKALGGKAPQPAFDTPYGRMAPVSDPFGVAFAIVQLAETK